MAKTRELRRRIRSIQNTRKLTHAMELVAGAKMRRAQSTVFGTRRYAELAWELLREVRFRSDVARHSLLTERTPVKRTAVFVVSGNRGLVGAFHERIVQRVLVTVGEEPSMVITMGKVARDLLHRRSVRIEADYPKEDLLSTPEDAAPVAAFLLSAFLDGRVDRVRMIYVDFRSVLQQDVRVRTLLPVEAEDLFLGTVNDTSRATGLREEEPPSGVDYVFEPSPSAVLEAVVPNLLSIQVYQALLETTASEHAARMVTMRNATENADEIHDDLTLAFNEARKAGITQEILEIVSGRTSMIR